MKKLYTVFLAFVLLVAVAFGLYSLVDKDDEISTAENRGLTQKPKFTFSSFFSGDYFPLIPNLFLFFAGASLGAYFKSGRAAKGMYMTRFSGLAFIGRPAFTFNCEFSSIAMSS